MRCSTIGALRMKGTHELITTLAHNIQSVLQTAAASASAFVRMHLRRRFKRRAVVEREATMVVGIRLLCAGNATEKVNEKNGNKNTPTL